MSFVLSAPPTYRRFRRRQLEGRKGQRHQRVGGRFWRNERKAAREGSGALAARDRFIDPCGVTARRATDPGGSHENEAPHTLIIFVVRAQPGVTSLSPSRRGERGR